MGTARWQACPPVIFVYMAIPCYTGYTIMFARISKRDKKRMQPNRGTSAKDTMLLPLKSNLFHILSFN